MYKKLLSVALLATLLFNSSTATAINSTNTRRIVPNYWELEDATTIRPDGTRDVHIEGDLTVDGAIIFGGAVSGDIDFGGNDILNVGYIRFDELAACDSTSGVAGHIQICADSDGNLYITDQAGLSEEIVTDWQGAIDGGETVTISNGDNQEITITNNDTTNDPDSFVINHNTDLSTSYALRLEGNTVFNQPLIRVNKNGLGTSGVDFRYTGGGYTATILQFFTAANNMITNQVQNNGIRTRVVGDLQNTSDSSFIWDGSSQDADRIFAKFNAPNSISTQTVDYFQINGNNGSEILLAVNEAGDLIGRLNSTLSRVRTINTTDATPTTIDTIATATDTSYTIESIFNARDTDTSADTALYKAYTRVENDGGTVTTTTNIILADDADIPTATVGSTVSGTNALLQVTGVAATNLDWTIDSHIIEN